MRYEPIAGRCGEILEALMSSPSIPSDEGVNFKLRLCAEEILENIVNYSGSNWLSVDCRRRDSEFEMEFADGGIRFDPLKKPDPDLTLSIEERPIGGLGIFICKQMMDTVSYRYEDGQNITTMSIKI